MKSSSVVRAMLPALLPLLAGCSFMGLGKGDFSCPGGIDGGVRCMTARQVYLATDGSDTVRPTQEADHASDVPPATSSGPPTAISPGTGGSVPVPTIEQPLPIRSQPGVMRIWIAPWEDDEGDLHADGYVYTEIESRKWSLGNRFRAPRADFAPLATGMAK